MHVEKLLQKWYHFFSTKNYVLNIETMKKEYFVYASARGYRSQRKNESSLSVNISLSGDGHVVNAKCSCADEF